MAFKRFVFLPTNYSLIFPSGTTGEDREIINPNFVKVFGFCLDSDMNPLSCYIYEDFASFNLDKSSLLDKLNNHCVIKSSGLIQRDQHWFNKITLNSYEFSDSFDFSNLVDF